jgi:hypothetical protein
VLTKSNAKQKQRGQTKKSSYDKKFMISSILLKEGTALVKLAEDAARNKKVCFSSVVVLIVGFWFIFSIAIIEETCKNLTTNTAKTGIETCLPVQICLTIEVYVTKQIR